MAQVEPTLLNVSLRRSPYRLSKTLDSRLRVQIIRDFVVLEEAAFEKAGLTDDSGRAPAQRPKGFEI